MESVSANAARAESLSQVLERDHRGIDGPLQKCFDGSSLNAEAKLALRRAVEDLRRHIFVEEEMLFPPLREAGMFGPIMVMLREHAQMWPLLETLDHVLVAGDDDEVLGATSRTLFELLQSHNSKEEQILYPQLEQVVAEDTQISAREFLDNGQVPADWICQHLRGRS